MFLNRKQIPPTLPHVAVEIFGKNVPSEHFAVEVPCIVKPPSQVNVMCVPDGTVASSGSREPFTGAFRF